MIVGLGARCENIQAGLWGTTLGLTRCARAHTLEDILAFVHTLSAQLDEHPNVCTPISIMACVSGCLTMH